MQTACIGVSARGKEFFADKGFLSTGIQYSLSSEVITASQGESILAFGSIG